MKILYITQYFYPELGATSNRAYANAKYLSDNGNDITVLTEIPNHPKGIIFTEYLGKIFVEEKIEKFKVWRVWVKTAPNKTSLKRIIFYFSFMLNALIASVLKWKNFDIVYVTSPPLFTGFILIVLKKIFRKTKFVFEVRDLWPESAIILNELRNERIINLSKWLEKSCYKNADLIITVTKLIKKKILTNNINKDKVKIITNGTNITNNLAFDNNILNATEVNYNLENKFIVLYAGLLGIAQDIETIIKAAEILKGEKDIKFLIIGDGANKDNLVKLKNSLKLENVLFLNQMKIEELKYFYKLSNCGIVSLKKNDLFMGALPSKIFDYMNYRLPVLMGVDGEAKEVIEKSESGLFFEPENFAALAEAILFMRNNKSKINEFAMNGRKFVANHFDREKLAAELFDALKKLVKYDNGKY